MSTNRTGRISEDEIGAAIAAHLKAADGARSAILRLLDEIRDSHPEHYERAKELVPDELWEGDGRQN